MFTSRFSGFQKQDLEKVCTTINEHPFASKCSKITVVYKGEIERILDCCECWYGTGLVLLIFSTARKRRVEEQVAALLSQGLRVIALAPRDAINETIDFNDRDQVERHCFSWLGWCL